MGKKKKEKEQAVEEEMRGDHIDRDGKLHLERAGVCKPAMCMKNGFAQCGDQCVAFCGPVPCIEGGHRMVKVWLCETEFWTFPAEEFKDNRLPNGWKYDEEEFEALEQQQQMEREENGEEGNIDEGDEGGEEATAVFIQEAHEEDELVGDNQNR